MQNNKEKVIDMIELHLSYLMQRAKFILPNSEDAEDIVQDVFIAAYEAIDKYKGDGNVKTWLSGILNHKVADYYRKKYKQPGQISLDSFFDEDSNWKKDQLLKTDHVSDEANINNEVLKKIIDTCIEKLPEKWAIPIKMYYLQEKKSDLISQELGITTTNLWKILQRGRLQLKSCIDSKWSNF